MPFAPVNGQRLFFEDGGGDKPVVVFSHGNLMNRWMWAPQIEALRARFRCVLWDQRLHGHTEDDHGLYTYWDSATDLLALMGQAVELEWPAVMYLADVDSGYYVANYLRAWAFEAQLRRALHVPRARADGIGKR